ncbi:MAG TPA: DUF6364 family protein [Candidatus Saccharimonadales bacterium]|jgi:hypothetical protein
MKTKLTLSVDKELVQYAQRQARRDGQSISGMFSSFLLNRKSQAEKKTAPRVTTMVGTLKQYPINDSKPAIRAAYAKKFAD